MRRPGPRLPTARDVMSRRLFVVRPEAPIADAIRLLLKKDVSGVPVVDAAGRLVGILSERDCLRVVAVGAYTSMDHDEARPVTEFMSEPTFTVGPEVGIYSLADFFLTHPARRLPVLEEGRLVGLVSRRDVLSGIRKMIRRGHLPVPEERRGPALFPSATDTPPEAIGKRLS